MSNQEQDISKKIRHTPPGFGEGVQTTQPTTPPPPAPAQPSEAELAKPLPVAESTGPVVSSKIRAIERERRHEDEWNRVPNTTGTGAIHVRSFHAKLTEDALVYMDRMINEWLDAHPQYEVKFVTSTVGVLTGKLKEPHLICQVWV